SGQVGHRWPSILRTEYTAKAGAGNRGIPREDAIPPGEGKLLLQRLTMQALVLPAIVELHAIVIVDRVGLEAVANLLARGLALLGLSEEGGALRIGRRRLVRAPGAQGLEGGRFE